jgi:hypothetical protein
MNELKRVAPSRKFTGKGIPAHISASMFWRWGFSDLRSNTTRGVLGEFLVACALGLQKKPRTAWTSYDLEYKGKKIEVKTTAYLQTWNYGKESRAGFRINPASDWDPSKGMGKTKQFNADIYVLCLFKARKPSVSEIDVNQWIFWVLNRADVERIFFKGKYRTVEWMEKESGVRSVQFSSIRNYVEPLI